MTRVAALVGALSSMGCGNGSDEVSSTGGVSGAGATNGNNSPSGTASGSGGARPGEGDAGTSGSVSDGAAGTGGSPAGGAGGASGAQSSRSPGCGFDQPLESGRITLDVGGTEREYVLDVPDSYDADHPYRLIFAWHWVGVTADDVVTGEPGPYGGLGPYYGLKALADESAIFVAPEGLDMGWYNEDDRDIVFLRAMLDELDSKLCIDPDRIFSVGFSYGAMMSIAVGCEMGDVFRAIAPMSGDRQSGCNESKDDSIAFWGAHGEGDEDIPPASGRAARDVFVERNHCEQQTAPVEPSPCVAYAGCDAGYPVHWCEFDDVHTQWEDAPAPLWSFFSQF